MENLLENSNTKFIAEKEIPDKNEDTHWLLKPETVVHVESERNESEQPQKKKWWVEMKKTTKVYEDKEVEFWGKNFIKPSRKL